jgi:hypothetical protein
LGVEVNFYVYPYQHKSQAYRDALLAAGHVEDKAGAQVVLLDRDWYMNSPDLPRREVREHPGAAFMVYPHSSLPPWWYDGLIKIQPYVKCVFVIGEGQKRAMSIFAPEARVEAVGWSWSEQRPFQPCANPRKILFAPIHPAGARLRPEAVDANRCIFEQLKTLEKTHEITVRYIGNRLKQGITNHQGFNMVRAGADGCTDEIDAADVVIAEGSMLYLAVARGKPVIGINEHLPIRANKHSDIYTPKRWAEYGPGMAYPINHIDAPMRELIIRAGITEPKQWRRDFIGEQFDPARFAAIVERVFDDC